MGAPATEAARHAGRPPGVAPLLVLVLALGLALASAPPAEAQTATVLTTVDRTEVTAGDTFELRVRVDVEGAAIDDMELPDLRAFRIVGHSKSRPVQFSFSFGGKMQRFESTSIHEFVLLAEEAGDYTIGAAKAVIGGRTFLGNKLKIRVLNAGAATGGQPQDPAPGPDMPAGPTLGERTVLDGIAFLDTQVSTMTPYVGEQVTVRVTLYTREPLTSQPQTSLEPTTAGFWVQDLVDRNHVESGRPVTLGARTYYAYELKRFAAFPLTAGSHTVGPMRMELRVPDESLMGFTARRVVRESKPITLTAKALPAAVTEAGALGGRTPTYGVGEYSLDAKLDRTAVRVGDAATLTATVTGIGNLRDITLALAEQPGLRVFAPEIKDTIEVRGERVGGTRTFRWLITPSAPGTYRIPAFTLNVLHPGDGSVQSLSTRELELVATGAAEGAGNASVSGAVEGTRVAPQDAAKGALPPLSPRASLKRREPAVSSRAWYPWALATPPALWAALMITRNFRRRRAGRAAARPAVAKGNALRHLRSLAPGGDSSAFYREAARVLRAALDHTAGHTTAGITLAALRQELEARGMAPDLAERVAAELEGFDFARFSASASSPEEMLRCADRVAALLERLERTTLSPLAGAPEDRP